MIRIALFSDIHGKFLLPFNLVDLYQQLTCERIDLILQCGDMGAFPDLEALDKATLKHASGDRDELGFADHFVKSETNISAFLEELNTEMICVRGNHEDHDFLDETEAAHPEAVRFPIDVYRKVWVCKTGYLQTWQKGKESLTFAGIGRIGDRKGRSEKRFIQEYERKALQKLMKKVDTLDVLISHDKDDRGDQGYGMKEIRSFLDEVPCHYHFYGHTGEPYQDRLDENGITRSIKIRELEFEAGGALPEGCMVILEKPENGVFDLKVVGKKITNQLTKHAWK